MLAPALVMALFGSLLAPAPAAQADVVTDCTQSTVSNTVGYAVGCVASLLAYSNGQIPPGLVQNVENDIVALGQDCLWNPNGTCQTLENVVGVLLLEAEQLIKDCTSTPNTLCASVIPTATTCVNGSNSTCNLVEGYARQEAYYAIGVALQCAQGNNDTCNFAVDTAKQLAGQVLAQVTACATGNDPTCNSAKQEAVKVAGDALATTYQTLAYAESTAGQTIAGLMPTVQSLEGQALQLVLGTPDDGGGGVMLDPTYVPPAPSAADLAAIAAKEQVQGEALPIDTALLASGVTGTPMDPGSVTEYPSCTDNPCAPPPPPASSPPSSAKVRIGVQKQQTNYYCVPASTVNILYSFNGVNYSQSSAASNEGTQPNGTDAQRIPPVLNANEKANTYQSIAPHVIDSPATLFHYVVGDVWRYRSPMGFTGDPALMGWGGGKVGTQAHEIALYGYSNANGGGAYALDPWNPTGALGVQRYLTMTNGYRSMKEQNPRFGPAWLTW